MKTLCIAASAILAVLSASAADRWEDYYGKPKFEYLDGLWKAATAEEREAAIQRKKVRYEQADVTRWRQFIENTKRVNPLIAHDIDGWLGNLEGNNYLFQNFDFISSLTVMFLQDRELEYEAGFRAMKRDMHRRIANWYDILLRSPNGANGEERQEIMSAAAANRARSALTQEDKDDMLNYTKNLLAKYKRAIELYKSRNGAPPADVLADESRGPGIGIISEYSLTRDAWETRFSYTTDGQEYTISSAGPDGKFGTEDDIVLQGGSK